MSGILYTILGSQCHHWPTVCIYMCSPLSMHTDIYTLMYTWKTYCNIQSLFFCFVLALIIRTAVRSGGFLIQIRLALYQLQAVLWQKRGDNSRSLQQTATWRKLLWSCVTRSCIFIWVNCKDCLPDCLLVMLQMTSHLVAWICCCIFSPFSYVREIRLSFFLSNRSLCGNHFAKVLLDQNKNIAIHLDGLFSIALTCFEVC